jgi:hypothetical protein
MQANVMTKTKNIKMKYLSLFTVFTLSIMTLHGQVIPPSSKKVKNNGLSKPPADTSKPRTIITIKDSLEQKELSRIRKENLALKDSVQNLTTLVQNINTLYLKAVFSRLYLEDTLFLKTADIPNIDTFKINRTTVLSNSLLISIASGDTLKSIKEVLDFNSNYIALYRIYADILSQKSDSVKIKSAIQIIDSLPAINSNWVLSKTKSSIKLLLDEYDLRTCDLIEDLNKFKNASDPTANIIQQAFVNLKNDKKYKYSPYFVGIIKKTSSNPLYNPEDDLNCKPR